MGLSFCNCVSVFRRALGDVDADVVWVGPGFSTRVKILCSPWFPETIALGKS